MTINFFTADFPYRNSEAFIENEIGILASRAGKINLFVHNKPPEKTHRPIPENCSICLRNQETVQPFSGKDLFTVLKMVLIEFIHTDRKFYFIRHLRKWMSLAKKAVMTANWLEKSTCFDRHAIHYSFWMNDWALALTVLQMRKKIDGFVFRCAGFDIWDERSPGNYLPFRSLIYRYADGIYPNSKMAENYLKSKKRWPEKINYFYLGTVDRGIAPFDPAAPFTLVSCSAVIPIKRVELIIAVIHALDFSINWVHFGEGSELDRIQDLAQKLEPKHTVVFKGYASHEEYYNFFRSSSINLFITTSSTEGLPVTLQEAISFGIPCMGTNVGGIKEVITPETGILIDADFDIAAAAKKIAEFRSSEKNSLEFRQGVRTFWEKKFNATIVYNAFVDELVRVQQEHSSR